MTDNEVSTDRSKTIEMSFSGYSRKVNYLERVRKYLWFPKRRFIVWGLGVFRLFRCIYSHSHSLYAPPKKHLFFLT